MKTHFPGLKQATPDSSLIDRDIPLAVNKQPHSILGHFSQIKETNNKSTNSVYTAPEITVASTATGNLHLLIKDNIRILTGNSPILH